VAHPGSALGQSASDGIAAFIQALRQAAKGLRLDGLTVLIENTEGRGAMLGRTFEEVAEIIAGAGRCARSQGCLPDGR
jgi:endonuclease IV